jgi:hypothetical protein
MRQADVLLETTASTFYKPSISSLLPTPALGRASAAKPSLHCQIVSRCSVGVCPGLLLLIRDHVLIVLIVRVIQVIMFQSYLGKRHSQLPFLFQVSFCSLRAVATLYPKNRRTKVPRP